MGKKVGLLILGYIISLALLFGGVNLYINHKDKNLRSQAYETFNNFFRHQNKYVDTQYSNGRIKYSQSSNPEKKPEKSRIAILDNLHEGKLGEWNDKFSDIYKFFRIDDKDDGWQLYVAEKYSYDIMIIYNIYPSYVGYKKQDYSYMYNWIPSVEDCVNGAYESWVTNPKSQYIDFYARGNKNKVDNLISNVRNEYYSWYVKDNVQPAGISGKIGVAGYMYNDYYKVFAETTKYTTYEIERLDYAINEDKIEIYVIGGVLFTLIFIGLLIPMIIKYKRKEKKLNEPLFDKLEDKVNSDFMNPYDAEKVQKANTPYNELPYNNKPAVVRSDSTKSTSIGQEQVTSIGGIVEQQRQTEKIEPQKTNVPEKLARGEIRNNKSDIPKKIIIKQEPAEELPEAKIEIEKEISQTLFVNYKLDTPENTDNYAIIRIPKNGCIVRSHRNGGTKRRGFKE